MDIIVAGFLGLRLMRDRSRSALNLPESHQDDQPWTLGPIPDSMRRAGAIRVPPTAAAARVATAITPAAPARGALDARPGASALRPLECTPAAACSVGSAA